MGNNNPLKIRHRSGRSRLSKTDGQKSVVWPGEPYPLGATWDGEGINLALFSENAEKVELCLFDPSGREVVERIEIREHTD
jgi:isoamylase